MIATRFKYLLFVFMTTISLFLYSQKFEYRKVDNDAFKPGEKLKFRVYYESLLTGKVDAGIATLEVKNSKKKFDSRQVYHIIGTGKSVGAFNVFFKVRDRYETYIDKKALISHYFVRRTREGGYVKDDDVLFDHRNRLAKSRTATKKIKENIQDVISAVFYARTIDFSNAKKGDNFSIDFFLDDSVYISVIQFQGREIVETELGIFRCLAFKPMVATGEVFSNPYPMTLWVTDDKNRLPVFAKSAVIIGSVKMELIKFSGLANPIEARIED